MDQIRFVETPEFARVTVERCSNGGCKRETTGNTPAMVSLARRAADAAETILEAALSAPPNGADAPPKGEQSWRVGQLAHENGVGFRPGDIIQSQLIGREILRVSDDGEEVVIPGTDISRGRMMDIGAVPHLWRVLAENWPATKGWVPTPGADAGADIAEQMVDLAQGMMDELAEVQEAEQASDRDCFASIKFPGWALFAPRDAGVHPRTAIATIDVLAATCEDIREGRCVPREVALGDLRTIAAMERPDLAQLLASAFAYGRSDRKAALDQADDAEGSASA